MTSITGQYFLPMQIQLNVFFTNVYKFNIEHKSTEHYINGFFILSKKKNFSFFNIVHISSHSAYRLSITLQSYLLTTLKSTLHWDAILLELLYHYVFQRHNDLECKLQCRYLNVIMKLWYHKTLTIIE